MANLQIIENAPAKINLALHVVGQRDDGYHLLESLVAFTEFGDRILGHISTENSFDIVGPFASELTADHAEDNLVIRARDALAHYAKDHNYSPAPVHLTCEKNLPIASGMGGGSADAAATLRLLIKLWKLEIPAADLANIAIDLGADVPMCLVNSPLCARGIGEDITLLSSFPQCHIIIANPLVAVSTPTVFKALSQKNNTAMVDPGPITTISDLIRFLTQSRNDLENPAIDISPEIKSCLDALGATIPSFARMSGSGASCFALYQDEIQAKKAMDILTSKYPDWFVALSEIKGI